MLYNASVARALIEVTVPDTVPDPLFYPHLQLKVCILPVLWYNTGYSERMF
ncbi:MAG: hypothetical protein JXQ72_07775 [Anaerolineae bacterium]|nr:hypothetical protein [Anaerolineae bacterium]